MAKQQTGYYDIELVREETRPIVFDYGPVDLTLPRFNITGQPIAMRIKPLGASEIVYGSPEISITDGPNGEFTVNIPSATVNAYTFQNAAYVILLNSKRLIYGSVTIRSLYE